MEVILMSSPAINSRQDQIPLEFENTIKRELEDIARKHSPQYRVYPWRDLLSYSSITSPRLPQYRVYLYPWRESTFYNQWGVSGDFQLRWSEAEFSSTTSNLGNLHKNAVWTEILEQLDTLVRWREEWAEDENQHEPEKPSELALSNAKKVVKELLSAVLSEGKEVLAPFISYDQDGYITFEWRNRKHELYLEITEDKIQYVTVWGINIDSEMDAGVPSKDNYLMLWEWLLDG